MRGVGRELGVSTNAVQRGALLVLRQHELVVPSQLP